MYILSTVNRGFSGSARRFGWLAKSPLEKPDQYGAMVFPTTVKFKFLQDGTGKGCLVFQHLLKDQNQIYATKNLESHRKIDSGFIISSQWVLTICICY